MEVGNYNQTYYIEKEGMRIDGISEDEEDESIEEEPGNAPPQVEKNNDPPSSSNAHAASFGTFDGLVHIFFS